MRSRRPGCGHLNVLQQYEDVFIADILVPCAESGSEEVGKSAGSPPALTTGADDIFWVNQLHRALDSKGFSPSEEDAESWYFGEQTLSALLTFQVGISMLSHNT